MSGISIGNLPNQSILKKINDIAADVNDLDLEGVNNLKSKLYELVAPELGSSDTKAISQKVVTENIQQLNTEVNNKINKVESAQNGNLPSFDNGHIKDSKIPASNIAQANGYYESMIVGASRNLAGNNIVTAKYTYRPTADTTDVADGVAKISSVKGNTIVWNQFQINTVASSYGDIIWSIEGNQIIANGVASMNSFSTNYTNKLYASHKYYFKAVGDFNNTTIIPQVYTEGKNSPTLSFTIPANTITSPPTDDLYTFRVRIGAGTIADNLKFRLMAFDLTKMFGEGNEPTIEEFEAMFPNDYYEYNEGELRSIEDFQIKSVGFNQWDEEWELGTISTANGSLITSSTMICSVNFIKVLPNTNYRYTFTPKTANKTSFVYFYDDDYKYISYKHNEGIYNAIIDFTTPKNCAYIKFVEQNTTVIDDTHRACINLSHSGIRNGEYEPYQEDILPINISTIKDNNGEVLFPNGLCSAGTAHDELVYDKTIGKWKAVKRIGSVDMGSLQWNYSNYNDSSKDRFVVTQGNFLNFKVNGTILCDIYPVSYNITEDKCILRTSYTNEILIIRDTSITNINDFYTAIQDGILYYELAEPIEVILDNFTSNYKVSDWGTEEILMNSTPIVPVIYDVEYALNAVDTLRNMPTNYISKESLDAFLSTLGSAMGGTWTAIYNETDGRYDFTFSATKLINE